MIPENKGSKKEKMGKNTCRKVFNRVLAGLFGVLFFLSAVSNNKVLADETSDKIKKAEELKKITEEQKQAIEDQKDDLVAQRETLASYLATLNEELAEISVRLEKVEDLIFEKEEEINGVNTELAALREEESSQYELMKKRIKNIYEKSNDGLVSRIMGVQSYADFLNKAEYVNKMESYDQKLFEDIVAIRERIEVDENALKSEMEELDVLKQQVEEEQQKVNGLVSTTAGSLAATSGAISAAEMEQAAYEAELKNQEKNLSALKKQLAKEQAMATKASKMSWRDVSVINYQVSDRDLLAALIYCEAGSEPYIGQVAVGAVVINRVRSAAYPNTIVGVIYQKGQFSPVASGRLATRLSIGANDSCYRAADEAMAGSTPVGNCLYFRRANPQVNGQIIGNHVFY